MPHQCTNCGRRFDDGSKEMLSGCPDCGGNKFQFQPKGREEPQESTPASSSGNGGQPAAETSAGSQQESTRSAHETSPAQSSPPSASTSTRNDDPTDANDAGDVPELAKQRAESEDNSQSDARSSFVSNDELDEARRKMAEAEEQRMSEVDEDARPDAADSSQDAGTGTSGSTEASQATEGLSGAVGPGDGASTEQPAADQPDESGQQPSTTPAPNDTEAEELEPEEDPNLQALREELNNQFESIKITAPGQYELNLMELYDREEYIISLREDGRYVIEMPETWGADE